MCFDSSKDIVPRNGAATLLPLKFHAENQELKQELLALYERETKLLNIIDNRDKQLASVPGRAKGLKATRRSSHQPQIAEAEHTRLKAELDHLRERYDALRKSKLGRVQLWYWRRKAGK